MYAVCSMLIWNGYGMERIMREAKNKKCFKNKIEREKKAHAKHISKQYITTSCKR